MNIFQSTSECTHYYCMFYRCPENDDGHLHCIKCAKVMIKDMIIEFLESSKIYNSRVSHERLISHLSGDIYVHKEFENSSGE